MKSKANELILAALQQVVGDTLKRWLDENKADVLRAVQLAATVQPPTPANSTCAPTTNHPGTEVLEHCQDCGTVTTAS